NGCAAWTVSDPHLSGLWLLCQSLTITCQVSYSVSSYYTAWIRQPAGKGLEWIGSGYQSYRFYKDSLKNQFSIDLDSSSNRVTLNGLNMQPPEDTAVYYCARSYKNYFLCLPPSLHIQLYYSRYIKWSGLLLLSLTLLMSTRSISAVLHFIELHFKRILHRNKAQTNFPCQNNF
uniref:Ig-like domain-containing protein n=1 Tax=Labrus bergylta TaxID=56723 RepID=A0A3Q3EVC9_9LABR